MTVELVTGKGADSHVGSDDIGLYNARTIGPGRYILHGCEATVVNANTVRIGEGEMLLDGRYVRVKGSEDVAIQSGVVDKKRIDLIAVRYSKGTDGVEDSPIAAIPGTPTAGEPADPAHVDGSILDGDVDVDIPVYRVRVDGLAVGDPELLIDQGPEPYVGHLHGKGDITDLATWAKADSKPSYTPDEVGAAAKSHSHVAASVTDLKAWLLANIFRVGYIWPSRVATNPASILGGTWVEITDTKLFIGVYLYRRTA
ncbi:hypothetical protein [Adlercreutzia faecimuris]|uniref:FHA domain-containing protein n=1 Tax=Adlercreutzia faecimuris TaxID=2897341 RepID=A0ABS9WFE8_9ACTN|nr:hypothetical protein [Adlercreutzia sp. JBNU-10]MCI2241524.1 hypothetical protein [Adlercreutzia sp. JBNU-10]